MTAPALERSVIVVASEETSSAWARRLRDDGIPARALPWSTIRPGPDVARALATLAPSGAPAAAAAPFVLLTSANAVRYLPDGIGRGHQAVVVGPGTARAARHVGFAIPDGLEGRPAAGFASVALVLVKRAGRTGRAIWLKGRPSVREGVDLLRLAGWTIDELVTYETVARDEFAADLRAAPPARAVVVGSPAAAEALGKALGAAAFPPLLGGPRILVPGETTAAALRVPGRAVPEIVADVPAGLAAALRAPPPAPGSESPWTGFGGEGYDPE